MSLIDLPDSRVPLRYPRRVTDARRFLPPLLVFALSCGVPTPQPAPTAPASPPHGRLSSDTCEALFADLVCGPTGELQRAEIEPPTGGPRVCAATCVENGLEHGEARYLQRTTPPTYMTGSHFRGRRTGKWTTRTGGPSGPTIDVTNYLHGPRHGEHRTFFPTGAPHVTGGYHRDTPHGRWTTQTPEGVVVVEETYDRGKLVGARITRHPNGSVATRTAYDPDGHPEGRWCAWSAAGADLGCTEFTDGTGVARVFAPDGAMIGEIPYEAGLRHGIELELGAKRREIPWLNGVQTGQEREIVDGCVVVERSLEAGRPHGRYLERVCRPAGEVLAREGEFCNGHFCGLWIERDPRDGVIRRITEYDPLSMKLGDAAFDNGRLSDFWTFDESMRIKRAACYQALASGLCCQIDLDYRVTPQCSAVDDTTTTEL